MLLDCFEMVNNLANEYEETHPNASHISVYNEFARIYDDCHSNKNVTNLNLSS
ncbi:hypothetical protein [Polaribacter sp. ALD11]|uniref:hypothetical protein n=1 Tax=Polaribacter sp. ALD11 TaxID=2058137 RepID=UPI0012FDB1BF|nr:hypothetical protein [Polaribacter sp. ALD11]